MKIGNTNYKIIADEVNIQLLQEYEVKIGQNKGSLDYKIVGWYSNMKDLCEGLLRREVKRSELKDLYTIIKRINEVEGTIREMNFSEIEIRRTEKKTKDDSVNWDTESGIPTIHTHDKTLRESYIEGE